MCCQSPCMSTCTLRQCYVSCPQRLGGNWLDLQIFIFFFLTTMRARELAFYFNCTLRLPESHIIFLIFQCVLHTQLDMQKVCSGMVKLFLFTYFWILLNPNTKHFLLPFYSARYGVEPPVLVKLEKEIELEETLLLSSNTVTPAIAPKSCCQHGELHEAVSIICTAHSYKDL